jgi:outer membrane protein OmpA-like peptidoglycan-associated protein
MRLPRAPIAARTLALLVSSLAFVGASAHAAEDANFAIERYRPALDRDGILDTESASVGQHLNVDVTALGMYELNPLVVYTTAGGAKVRSVPLVANRLGGNLMGAVSLFDWVQLGLDLPFTLYQNRDVGPVGPLVANPQASLGTTGIGDLRVVPKLRILREQDQGINVAIIPAFTLPSGTPQKTYLGDEAATFDPEIAIGRSFGGFRANLNAGLRLRPTRTFLNTTFGSEVDLHLGAAYRFHDSLHLPLEIAASLSNAYGIVSPLSGSTTPLEINGGLTYDLWGPLQGFVDVGAGIVAGLGTPDLRVIAGMRFSPRNDDLDGDGIPNDKDQCPKEAEDKDGFEDSDGCPDPDNDKDGILDVDDKCPNEAGDAKHHGCPAIDTDKDGIEDADDACPKEAGTAELKGCPDADKDGIADKDDACPNDAGSKELKGCPDTDKDGIADKDDACPKDAGPEKFKGCPDTDKDGIPDNTDKCPTEPEDKNGPGGKDGCPAAPRVTLTDKKVELLEKVYFDTDKDTIQERSFPLLNEVSEVLKKNAQVTKVRIEGHTDSEGSTGHNQNLSQRRANAVMKYLTDKGVDAKRLTAAGFGESKPIADNATEEGREKNRRVEMNVIEIDGKPVTATTKVESKPEPKKADAVKADDKKADAKPEAKKADDKAAPKADAKKADDKRPEPKKP